jgi:lipid II:glycine glycyltransferase (peptidoglycan interpeptide bridge formation enzyme)
MELIAREFSGKNGDWNSFANEFNGHPLQFQGWGAIKTLSDWDFTNVEIVAKNKDCECETIVGGAKIYERRLPAPFGSILHIPRGPFYRKNTEKCEHDKTDGLGEITLNDVLKPIYEFAKTGFDAISIVVEPDELLVSKKILRKTQEEESDPEENELKESEEYQWEKPWKKSKETIYYPKTLIIDLKKSDEELLKDMKKKTRQYINKSLKNEKLLVREAKDERDVMDSLEIYKKTAEKANFPIHEDMYYFSIYHLMNKNCKIYVAEINGKLVGFLWNITSANIEFELYGGVSATGQKELVNYALKWKAIQAAKERGVQRYDLNGLLNDGISYFKKGFSDHEDFLVGTGEAIFKPEKNLLFKSALKLYKKTKN